MPDRPLEVYWRDNLIGVIPDAKIDNFDIYGKWRPIEGEYYRRFLAEYAQVGEPWIVVGRGEHAINGTVQDLTDTNVEIKVRFGGQG